MFQKRSICVTISRMATKSAIRERRHELGYTQAELAELVGTTRQTVNGWEAGRATPSFTLMPRLSMALSRTPQELVPGWMPGAARVGGPTRKAAA